MSTLLLDLDGTLIDSRHDLASAVNHVLKELGHPPQTLEQIIPKIGNGLRRLLVDSIGLTDPVELQRAKDLFTDFYDVHCVDETEAYPGVKDGLGELTRRCKIGVVTNKPKPFADKILQHLDLDKFVDALLGGDSLPQSKPDPAPLLEMVKILHGKKENSLMVGDGLQDLKAGKAAGIKTCVARYGFGFRPEFLELAPDHTIDKFTDLKEILK